VDEKQQSHGARCPVWVRVTGSPLLAAFASGDSLCLDVAAGRLDLELARARPPPRAGSPRLRASLRRAHSAGRDAGCDFDFLQGAGGVPEDAIY
jgi:hypothetical protein